MWFELLIAPAGALGGAIASVSGFGIGSVLTPLLTYQTGAKLAVAAVALPHAAAVRMAFGVLLMFAGVMGLTGLAQRWRFGRRTAWIAGFISGGLGGFAGTQGGIRAAALFGFDLSKQAFVATSTAVGLLVDAARTPVYLATQWNELLKFCRSSCGRRREFSSERLWASACCGEFPKPFSARSSRA